jgi:hypothetical protein
MIMINKKPKGKTPSLIGLSNGRPKRVIVERKCVCFRCESDIENGQECYGIPKIQGGFTVLKRYCKACFENILQQTYKDLEEIKNI